MNVTSACNLACAIGICIVGVIRGVPSRATDCPPVSSAASCFCLVGAYSGVATGTVTVQLDGPAYVTVDELYSQGPTSSFVLGEDVEPDRWSSRLLITGQIALLTDLSSERDVRHVVATIVPPSGTVAELMPLAGARCDVEIGRHELAEFLGETANCEREFYPRFGVTYRTQCDSPSCGSVGLSTGLTVLGALAIALRLIASMSRRMC